MTTNITSDIVTNHFETLLIFLPISTDFESNTTLSGMANRFVEGASLNDTFRMENFSYENSVVMETLSQHLENTSFVGVSVSVFIHLAHLEKKEVFRKYCQESFH